MGPITQLYRCFSVILSYNTSVSSCGIFLFSHLISDLSFIRLETSLLGWSCILALYAYAYFLTSYFTIGISKSLCKILYVTYQDESTIILRTLDWNLCRILMFNIDAVSYNYMSSIGLIIVLYMITVYFFNIQLRFLANEPIHFM